jgi:hyaluronoglucosaminidase
MGFLKGVVEGFYGSGWSWPDRVHCVDFLAANQLNSYLYCPKNDSCLRREWQQEWPSATRGELERFGRHCEKQSIDWGVGLSPFALYQDYGAPQRRVLQRRIGSIADLGGRLLGVLFDDMPGDCPDLAQRQAEIVADIAAWHPAAELLVCPTYYSFDPQLEQYFGPRSAHYWRDLGALLPPQAQVFWTGNEVCSKRISTDDARQISAKLGRKPLLWDNYPVNDGKQACNFLHLEPLPDRAPGLATEVTGHLCNPMSQAHLSCYPLAGLAALYGAPVTRWEDHFAPALCALLQRDWELFQHGGLDAVSADQGRQLVAEYGALSEPAAAEVVAWLSGEYLFDPACLTD